MALGGLPACVSQIHIDLKQLEFELREARRTQRITFVAVLLDQSGVAVAGKLGTVDFALTDPSFQRFREGGVNATLGIVRE